MTKRFIGTLLLALFWVNPSLAIIQPKVIKTPGGLTAWYTYDDKTPVIAINFAFKGGARLDPEGKAGLASFSASILDSGTMNRDPKDLDAFKQDYAIQLGFSGDTDQLGGSLATLAQHKDKAFDLLHEVLTSPRLKEDVFDITMNQATIALANIAKDPSYLANRHLQEQMFPNHPYRFPSDGLPETIKNITLKDVGTYLKDNLTKDRLVISINGNIKEADAIKALDKIFTGLPDKAAKALDSKVKPVIDGSKHIIDMQIPQSMIYFVMPGITYDDPDFMKAALLLHIVGESQGSRLFREVREKKGLAYDVAAAMVWLQEAGYIVGMVGTTKTKANQSIDIVRQEWQRLKKEGITAEELEDAKTFMLNSYPLKFKNSGAIGKIQLGYQLFHRPVDYFQKRDALIKGITLKEMNDFIARVIEPEKLTFVIVGRPEEVPALDIESDVKKPKVPTPPEEIKN